MAKREIGSPEWIRDIAIPEYKERIKKLVRAYIQSAANKEGYESIEDAKTRFLGTSSTKYIAQLISEWETEIYSLTGAHLQGLKELPADDSFIDSLPPITFDRVPVEVTKFQARMALESQSITNNDNSAYELDLLQEVENYLNNAANFPNVREQKRARISWEDAKTLRRDSPLLQGVAAILGFSSEDLDDLFRAAVRLQ